MAATKTKPAPATQKTTEPRNFLAAFLLTASFGPTGLHQLYLGRTTQAWVRFGLLIGGFLLSIVLIGIPMILVAYVWGLVDFFLVYLQRKDMDGKPLASTKRDDLTAKIIFITVIVAMVLYVLLFAFLLAFGLMAGSQLQYGPGSGMPHPYYPSFNSY